jgi:hypothetical protein
VLHVRETRPTTRTGRLISDDLLVSAWARCEFFVVEVLTRALMRVSVLPVLGPPLAFLRDRQVLVWAETASLVKPQAKACAPQKGIL